MMEIREIKQMDSKVAKNLNFNLNKKLKFFFIDASYTIFNQYKIFIGIFFDKHYDFKMDMINN